MHLVYHQAASGAWMRLKNYLLREVGHFPRVSWLLQRPVPTRLLFYFNISFPETGNLPILRTFIPKCSKQAYNKGTSEKYVICSIVFLLLLLVCIAKGPYVPVDANLIEVLPWEG